MVAPVPLRMLNGQNNAQATTQAARGIRGASILVFTGWVPDLLTSQEPSAPLKRLEALMSARTAGSNLMTGVKFKIGSRDTKSSVIQFIATTRIALLELNAIAILPTSNHPVQPATTKLP